jgi:hypothetical protein
MASCPEIYMYQYMLFIVKSIVLNTNLDINYRQTYFENIKKPSKNISGKSRNFSK